MFNFSTFGDVFIKEDVGVYLNLSLIKIGQNEPNVTVNVGVTEVLKNTKGMCPLMN